MKSTKIYSLIIMMMFGISHFVGAQAHSNKEDWKKDRGHGISNLTDEQKGQMKIIQETYKVKVEALKNDEKLSDESRREAMKELRQKKREDFKVILTEEQLKEMQSKRSEKSTRFSKENKSEMKKVHHKRDFKKENHSQGNRSQKMMKHLVKELNLSESQQAKTKEVNEGFSQKRQEIRNNEKLSKDDKKKAMIDIRQAQFKSFSEVLDKDQQQRLDEIKEKHKKNVNKKHSKVKKADSKKRKIKENN